MSEIIIRPAEPRDFKAIQEIQLSGGDALLTMDTPIDIIDLEQGSKNEDVIIGVAEINNEIVGFIFACIMNTRWCVAQYFAVRPDFRGSDAYSKLGNWFTEKSKSKGVKYLILYAESENKKLVNFYKHFGFKAGDSYVEMIKEI